MTRNDILSRLCFILNYNTTTIIKVYATADHPVTEEQVNSWLAKEEDPLHTVLHDKHLALFLNGLINYKRGKRPGPQQEPEMRLTNNIIVSKLKIALNFQGEDMLRVLKLASCRISNHELSAYFRKRGQKHYRNLNDQVFEKFLTGLQLEFRPAKD